MSLPEFDERGLLPARPNDAPYICTMEELYQRLVVDLGSPEWRVRLMNGFSQLRLVISRLVPDTRWWMWGELCSTQAQPRFGDASSVNALAFLPVPNRASATLLDLQAARSVIAVAVRGFETDAGSVVEVADSDAAYLDAKHAVETKWRPRASTWIFENESADVGFVEVAP